MASEDGLRGAAKALDEFTSALGRATEVLQAGGGGGGAEGGGGSRRGGRGLGGLSLAGIAGGVAGAAAGALGAAAGALGAAGVAGVGTALAAGDAGAFAGGATRSLVGMAAATPFGKLLGFDVANNVAGRAEARVSAVTEDLARYGIEVDDQLRKESAQIAVEQERRVEAERAKVHAEVGSTENMAKASQGTPAALLFEILTELKRLGSAGSQR